jgi:hypothetical protein
MGWDDVLGRKSFHLFDRVLLFGPPGKGKGCVIIREDRNIRSIDILQIYSTHRPSPFQESTNVLLVYARDGSGLLLP